MSNGGMHRPTPPQKKPSPWPVTVGCLGFTLMLCVTAVVVALIVYGG